MRHAPRWPRLNSGLTLGGALLVIAVAAARLAALGPFDRPDATISGTDALSAHGGVFCRITGSTETIQIDMDNSVIGIALPTDHSKTGTVGYRYRVGTAPSYGATYVKNGVARWTSDHDIEFDALVGTSSLMPPPPTPFHGTVHCPQ